MTPIGIATRNVVTFMGGFIGVPAMAVVVFEEQRDRLVDQTANLHTPQQRPINNLIGWSFTCIIPGGHMYTFQTHNQNEHMEIIC